MMEYAQYQPAQNSHSNPHMQTAYSSSAGGNSITSPSSQHLPQTSPILQTQQHQPSPTQGHSMYQTQYGVPQQNMHYGMPLQAAALAATAAASGTNYPNPYMAADPNLQQSPRMSGVNSKKDARAGPRSPQQMNSIPPGQRRLSQVASPGVPNAQAMLSHASRSAVPPPMTAAQQMPPPQSPEMASGAVEESPLYVNAKQFHRILKRRVARQKLEEQLRLTNKGRKPYLHESRHNHAMRRPRGPGGRFLTADEVAQMERDKTNGDVKQDGSEQSSVTAGSKSTGGTKRKAESNSGGPNKKAKAAPESPEDDDASD
ncbi:CCAAT-binding transcription factor (CBF-B/NF-YA) subunit B-domain-containing protein [Neurospora tetraspora]|uniref:Transcriptional activator HAP2 n=1 Tax=Neurospora tetraspora TaxID=94610 RepID=A0AAE0JR34_9PEZI|nr:CCAAT-binding transcription factor (CBF-B/NF-YA) subunit B-domain-containing protein [Neurospora tetraspora]